MNRDAAQRIAATSRQALDHLRSELPIRERAVVAGLKDYRAQHGHEPTAYELFREMQAHGEMFDVNSVRPRLTSLRDGGVIVAVEKRRCTVTGHTAQTWGVNATAIRADLFADVVDGARP